MQVVYFGGTGNSGMKRLSDSVEGRPAIKQVSLSQLPWWAPGPNPAGKPLLGMGQNTHLRNTLSWGRSWSMETLVSKSHLLRVYLMGWDDGEFLATVIC